MRRGRGEIGNVERLLAVRLDQKTLMVRRMSRCRNAPSARDDLPVALDEVDQPRLDQRDEVVREITRRRALIRVRRVLVLATLHHVAGVGERWPNRTVRRA